VLVNKGCVAVCFVFLKEQMGRGTICKARVESILAMLNERMQVGIY
jgi:hypothetical protein